MATPGTTVTSKTASELVRGFVDGTIQIPEVQRDVVWEADKVINLLDSVQKDYPCGSIIIWEPKKGQAANIIRDQIRPEILEALLKQDPEYRPKYFLIDGQQRLTALTAVIEGPEFLKSREPEAEYDWATFFVNLRKPTEIIAVDSEDAPPKFPYVKTRGVFDGSLLIVS